MKKIKADILKTELPKKSAFVIETEAPFPKLHALSVFVGKRGGGKTVALVNYLKVLKEKQYIQKVFVITPTYASNKQIWDIACITQEDCVDPTRNAIKQIIDKGQAEVAEWELFLHTKKLYDKFKNEKREFHQISDREMMDYYENGILQMNERPKWKYKKECPPRIAFVLDDCLNSDAMRLPSAGLVNLCIRHRHIYDGLGISVFMLVQSYCCMGGVPRPIRENTTNLILFKINDEKQLKKIHEECDLPISYEDFVKVCMECWKIPYGFLFIDFSTDCQAKRLFRSGFNEFIELDSMKHLCKCAKK